MKKIKTLHRIPTEQFAFVEFELEHDTPEEAIVEHTTLCSQYRGGEGLKTNEWAKVRDNMLLTGECAPNLLEEMNKPQRYFINELKKALRANKAEDPVIE